MSTSGESLWDLVDEAAGRAAGSRDAVGARLMLAMSQVMAACGTDHDVDLEQAVLLAKRYWSGYPVSLSDLNSCLERAWDTIDVLEREAAVDRRLASKWRCAAIILQPRFSSAAEIDAAVEAFCCLLRGYVGSEYEAERAIVSRFR